MIRRLLNNKIALSAVLILTGLLFVIPETTHAGLLDILATPVVFVTKLWSVLLEIVILPLAAGILYISGTVLDTAINFSLHTAYIFSLSPAVNLGWTIVRDLANIFFIFILIWISINTIVSGTSSNYGLKKMLSKVIIAAILINFSLFATKAVIDMSNIFGNWLYGGIQKTLDVNTKAGAKTSVSMSGLIVSRLGIVRYWQSDAKDAGNSLNVTDSTSGIVNTFIRLVVVLLTTYIFCYAGILFITRSITLLILLVFSPIGFMGEVLPQISEYSSEWRSELTKAAMFPLVFLLMLYIVLQFINGVGALTGTLQAAGNSTVKLFGANFDVNQMFQYFLIIFLLNATLKVAKKYSDELGKKANSIASSLGKFAVNTAVNVGSSGTALALRSGAAAVFAQRDAAGNINRGKAAWDTFRSGAPILNRFGTGKSIVQDVKKDLKEGSYDVRNAKIPLLGKTTFAEALGNATDVKIDTKDREKYNKETKEFKDELKIEQDISQTLKDIREIEAKKVQLAAAAPGSPAATALQTDINNLADGVRKRASKLSNKDLEKTTQTLHDREKDNNTLANFTDQLKPNQADHINNSELPGFLKKRNQDLRSLEFNNAIRLAPGATRTAAIARGLQKLSNNEAAKIDINLLNDPDVISALKVGHLQKIMDEYSYSQRTVIRNAIMARAIPAPNDPAYKWLTSPGGTQF